MALDISTMSVMVSASSILQSITLIFFFFLANKYPGVGIYAIGTLLSAIGFLIFPIRPFISNQLIALNLRFLGNLLITYAQILYTIGIIKFLNKKPNSFFFIALASAFLVIQVYFVYIKNDFIVRNMDTIFTSLTAYFGAIYYLIKFRERYLYASSIFICISFVFNIIFLLFRAIVLPLTNTKTLLDSNLVNLTTFGSIFLFDYLRNAGFIMMICQRLYHNIHQLATLDFLTNTLNRRAMQQCLDREIAKFHRSKTLFSLIMLDVDRFKLINDTYGHDRGDLVLQHLTTILKQNLRSQDILSRWGGEEFLILLPNTDIQESFLMANKLRTTVEKNPANNRLIYYTVSLGVGTFNQEYTGKLDSLLVAIDQALYQAKENGRNQVVIAKNP
ncbi:GGDEF domain-containing protein [Planktothrix paucivesiculata]|uniref:Diguanylate cyclase n=1 Tax=Planktothrix paucivesiculata PCC 9631 TaxID=671071 RepID=A0A7Z9BWA8_9CYAN|nr:GGDEF domain-containing protein [Planktothrix paucivesiculata]VXD23949.1 putative Diguanylate cyclase [Planktothrix paucivesiculata PCC 9631]